MLRVVVVTVISGALCACAGLPSERPAAGSAVSTVTLPLQRAWHDDQVVFYISTDISDAGMAAMMGSNFSPRLAQAVPALQRSPLEKTALERVYKFPGDSQEAVFASVPDPIGPTSRDAAYSPLWQVFWVKWKEAVPATLLKSEEAILAAEERGAVEIIRTEIVVNCPVVGSEAASLPGATMVLR